MQTCSAKLNVGEQLGRNPEFDDVVRDLKLSTRLVVEPDLDTGMVANVCAFKCLGLPWADGQLSGCALDIACNSQFVPVDFAGVSVDHRSACSSADLPEVRGISYASLWGRIRTTNCA